MSSPSSPTLSTKETSFNLATEIGIGVGGVESLLCVPRVLHVGGERSSVLLSDVPLMCLSNYTQGTSKDRLSTDSLRLSFTEKTPWYVLVSSSIDGLCLTSAFIKGIWPIPYVGSYRISAEFPRMGSFEGRSPTYWSRVSLTYLRTTSTSSAPTPLHSTPSVVVNIPRLLLSPPRGLVGDFCSESLS